MKEQRTIPDKAKCWCCSNCSRTSMVCYSKTKCVNHIRYQEDPERVEEFWKKVDEESFANKSKQLSKSMSQMSKGLSQNIKPLTESLKEGVVSNEL